MIVLRVSAAVGILAALLAEVVVEAPMILVGTLVLPASMAPLFLMARQPQVVLTVLIVPMVLAAMVAQVEPATLAVVPALAIPVVMVSMVLAVSQIVVAA